MCIARRPDSFLAAKYRRLARTRGKPKALVALERALLTVIWTMLTTGAFYEERGPDWHARQHPQRLKNQALRQLNALGYNVTIEPRGAA